MRKKYLPITIIVVFIMVICYLFNGQNSLMSGEEKTDGQIKSAVTELDITQPVEEDILSLSIEEIDKLPAHSIIDTGNFTEEDISQFFYASEITEEVYERINHNSYKENDNIDFHQLSYIRVLHRGIDGNTYIGELIVNREISKDILEIMRELYRANYPIERMVLVDEYQADDEASMEANNTSAFNYRTIEDSDKLSNHSYGFAIDINPVYNPYVKKRSNGTWVISPESGADYIDRSTDTLGIA